MDIRHKQIGITKIKLTFVGRKARQVLSIGQTARLIGLTSRGIFLQTSNEIVLFLTWEKHTGPLTLNQRMRLPVTMVMEVGDPVSIEECSLWFPKQRLLIAFGEADTWQAPSLPDEILAPRERYEGIEQLKKHLPLDSSPFLFSELQYLSQSIKSCEFEPAIRIIIDLLGRGMGLTPQGDDFVIGLLLTLNRWRSLYLPGLQSGAINQRVIQAARGRTTALSSSLIACSAEGQADQRLVCALDGLVTGKPDPDICAALFKEWGSTSGCASFQGMALALNTAVK